MKLKFKSGSEVDFGDGTAEQLHGEYVGELEMTQAKIDLKKLREQAMIHTSRFPVLALLDAIEETRASLEFYADDSIQTREVVTQYKDSPPWTGFAKETGDDRRKSDKGNIARAALAKLKEKFE